MSKASLTDQQRRCFDIIEAAAEAGERCPTSVEIADRLNTSPSYIDSVFVGLAAKGYITIEGTVKGRIVTVRKTGKMTARINAMPHRVHLPVADVGIMPVKAITPGRYLLDDAGRLQPLRYRKFVKVVAIVTVKAKPEIKPAERVDVVEPIKVAPKVIVAQEPRPEPILRPLARKAKPTPVRVPAEELVDEDPDVAEFQRRLAAKRAERAKAVSAAAKIDGARLAQVLRQREVKAVPAPVKQPTKYAQTREACRFCGIPGSRGCEHFLPYEGDAR